MCGRFALAYPRSRLIDGYHAVSMPEIEPRYNIAPTDAILVIRGSEQGRVGSMMRWGLIPHGSRIPTSCLYCSMRVPNRWPSNPCSSMRFEDSPLSFAGLWETATVDEVTIDSCTIITTESNTVMRSLHDRIPVILPPEVWDTWLTPTQQPDAILLSLLQFYSAEQLQLWAVSPAVGRASNEGAQLIQPIHD